VSCYVRFCSPRFILGDAPISLRCGSVQHLYWGNVLSDPRGSRFLLQAPLDGRKLRQIPGTETREGILCLWQQISGQLIH